jgi:ERCC4-related helicase
MKGISVTITDEAGGATPNKAYTTISGATYTLNVNHAAFVPGFR